jgi:dUTP pyrophosphatase
MNVKIINKSSNTLPNYATIGSAGMDIRANINEAIQIYPFERKVVKTGLYIELPIGFEAQIRPRSGLALKKGLSIPNSPGTIDSDYRGEIGVILMNLSNKIVTIEPSERIAQMVIAKYETIEWNEVADLGESDRGTGGFGSTGKR